MIQLNLQENERIINECEKVKYHNDFICKLILTNLNIIFIKDGFFNSKKIIKISLNEIKIVDGDLQVFYKKDKLKHRLNFYLKTHLLDLIFNKKSDAINCLNEINKILILNPLEKIKHKNIEEKEKIEREKKEQEIQEKQEKIKQKELEKKEIVKDLKKRLLNKILPEKINFNCIGCGFQNHGKIGSTIICNQCKLEQTVVDKNIDEENKE